MANELTSLTLVDTTTLKIGAVTVSSSAAELNILNGVTATGAEINRSCDKSGSVVAVTGSTVSLTAATHGSRTITLDRAAGITVTLPASTGSGETYRCVLVTTVTSNNTIIQVANSSDVMDGSVFLMQDNDVDGDVKLWKADAGDDTITMGGTTTGGFKGTIITCTDVAANLWSVEAIGIGSGSLATVWSAAV